MFIRALATAIEPALEFADALAHILRRENAKVRTGSLPIQP